MSADTVKKVPEDHFFLFKSCMAGSTYPGIELATKYVLDKIGAHYTDDPRQSSCAGFAVYTGVMPLETSLALNARNLSLASGTADNNVICLCPSSYSNLQYAKKQITKDEELKAYTSDVLRQIGMSMDCSPSVTHASDVFRACLGRIKSHAVRSLSGVRAVTHHGCHYYKIFFADTSPGNYERPTVLDDLLQAFDCEVSEYSERGLCCGRGLHGTMLDQEYTLSTLRRKFASIARAKPDVIITQCPGCTFNLDYYQESLAKELGMTLDIPVLYFSELLALLLGADPYEIGLDMHAVPVEPFLEKIGIKER